MHQSVLWLNAHLRRIFKMDKINRKTIGGEYYSLRRYVNCVSPPRENTTTLPTNIALCEVASNSNRKQTLYETTK